MKKNKSIKYKKQKGGAGTMMYRSGPFTNVTSQLTSQVASQVAKKLENKKNIPINNNNSNIHQFTNFMDTKNINGKAKPTDEGSKESNENTSEKMNKIWKLLLLTTEQFKKITFVQFLGFCLALFVAMLPTICIILIVQSMVMGINFVLLMLYKKIAKPLAKLFNIKTKRPKLVPPIWIILWNIIKIIFGAGGKKKKTSKSIEATQERKGKVTQEEDKQNVFI